MLVANTRANSRSRNLIEIDGLGPPQDLDLDCIYIFQYSPCTGHNDRITTREKKVEGNFENLAQAASFRKRALPQVSEDHKFVILYLLFHPRRLLPFTSNLTRLLPKYLLRRQCLLQAQYSLTQRRWRNMRRHRLWTR
jgi:hypothetical protein